MLAKGEVDQLVTPMPLDGGGVHPMQYLTRMRIAIGRVDWRLEAQWQFEAWLIFVAILHV